MPNYHPGWIVHQKNKSIDIHPGDRILFAIGAESSDTAIRTCGYVWWSYERFMTWANDYDWENYPPVKAYKIMRKQA